MTASKALLGLVLLTSGCGRLHTLRDGAYQVALDSVIKDDCALASTPGVFGRVQLQTSGHVVVMDTASFGTPIQLVGNYLDQELGGVDRMRLDGSAANVTTTINGTECLLDQVVLHIDSTTVNATRFSGNYSIELNSAKHNECVCQFWFKYVANAVN